MKFNKLALAMGALSMTIAACGSSNAPTPESSVTNYVYGEQALDAPLQADLAFAGTDLFVVTGVFGVFVSLDLLVFFQLNRFFPYSEHLEGRNLSLLHFV